MILSLIVAVSDNDVVAKDGRTPWFVRGEKAIFKQITMGSPIIMGRKTHDFLGRTLKGRTNIVLSHNPGYQVQAGSQMAGSFDEALDLPIVKNAQEVFVIGGQEILEAAEPLAKKIYLTRVHTTIQDGDRFFHFDPSGWEMIESVLYKKNEVPDRPYAFEFQIWKRR